MDHPHFDSKLNLELAPDQIRAWTYEALERIIQHFGSFADASSDNSEEAFSLFPKLKEGIPTQGASFSQLLHELFQQYIPPSLNTAGPGYLGYIPGGGLYHSALADLIAHSINRFVCIPQTAPLLTQLESNVIRWFLEIIGFPATTGKGVLTTGGSQANFMAILCARIQKLPENFLKGTIYTSDQAHHSLQKAARMCGFPLKNLRLIPSTPQLQLDLFQLSQRIEEDLQHGFQPFMLVAHAGTTNAGTIDPIAEMAKMAQKYDLWFHIDGAYGGFFCLTERGRKNLGPLHQADSLTLDPHKSLFLPYGTGAFLAKDGSSLEEAFSYEADYLPSQTSQTSQPSQESDELWNFHRLSPELSREFRGLRVWLPLKLHGVGVFERYLNEKLDLAQWIHQQLSKIPEIEIPAPPQLSLFVFRLNSRQKSAQELNSLNMNWLKAINNKKRVFLSGTHISQEFYLRICVLSFRTHLEHLQWALDDIRSSMAEL